MNTMNKEPGIRINLSRDTSVESPVVFTGRVVWDSAEVGHTIVLQSGKFYHAKDERKPQDRIYKPQMPIFIPEN